MGQRQEEGVKRGEVEEDSQERPLEGGDHEPSHLEEEAGGAARGAEHSSHC